MSNTTLNLIFPMGIGEITNKKIKVLETKFINEFPNAIRPNDSEFIIESINRSMSISFKPNQTIINHNDINKDIINQVHNYLHTIIESFMLDDFIKNINIRLINVVEFGKDTFEITKSFADNMIINKWDNVSGVGFRYLMKKDNNVFDEFKLEPLLADSNKFFFEGSYYIFNIKINEVSDIIYSHMEKFNKMKEDIISEKLNNK